MALLQLITAHNIVLLVASSTMRNRVLASYQPPPQSNPLTSTILTGIIVSFFINHRKHGAWGMGELGGWARVVGPWVYCSQTAIHKNRRRGSSYTSYLAGMRTHNAHTRHINRKSNANIERERRPEQKERKKEFFG